jgi:hypothetical protein
VKKSYIALAAIAALFAATGARAEFNANIEFDNAYLNNDRGLSQSGRVELNALGKVGSQYFVAGKASFLAKKDGTTATDDMWVQFGSAAADLKLGRFEAADLFPLPRDAIVLYAGAGVYRANLLRGRFGNASNGQGFFHAAGTGNFGPLSVELGLVETKADDIKGIRPVVTYAAGPLTLRLGIEAVKFGSGDRETGIGFTGKYDLGGITPIVNIATIKVGGDKSTTFGLIVDTAMGATVGYIHGQSENSPSSDYKTDTFYAAYQMPLFDIKDASVTFAGSFSKGAGSNTAPDEKGLKVRFNYTF